MSDLQPSQDFYVYAHRRSDCGSIFYVGKGRGKRAASRHGRNPYWGRVAAKYGFSPVILRGDLSEAEAFDLEAKTIAFYRTVGVSLTNMTDGGEGPAGREFSEETKEKMRAAKVGRKLNPEHVAKIAASNTGKKRSEQYRQFMREKGFTAEHRANISKAQMGRKLTPETIDKIRESKRKNPKPYSEARRAKISASQRGERNANFNPVTHTFVHLEHGEITCTQNELRKRFGVAHSNLSHMVSGKKGRVQGWSIKKDVQP